MSRSSSRRLAKQGTPKLDQDESEDYALANMEDPSQDPYSTTTHFKSSLDRFRHVEGQDIVADSRSTPGSIGTKRGLGDEGLGTDRVTRPVSISPLKKRRRESARYAPPSQYAHLPGLTDILEPNLIGVFVGFNPGVTTATVGHAYAHPSNMFWKLLHSSGITESRLKPEQDVDLPRLCRMGNTNIVERPSKNAGQLSKHEVTAGTPILEDKIRKFRPEAVCIVGKSIWEAIWRWRYKRELKKSEFHYGWQDESERMGKTEDWEGASVFVATATSGLNASLKPHEKEEIWKPFGEFVRSRQCERADEEYIKK